MSINQLPLPISSSSSRNLVSIRFLSGVDELNLLCNFSQLSISRVCSSSRKISTVIRMGRKIYPGGVSRLKWQILQKEKARKLHEAGLVREKKVYQKRRKAELREAVSEVERPWEVVERGAKLVTNVGSGSSSEEEEEDEDEDDEVGRGTVEYGDFDGLITEREAFDTQGRTDVRLVRRSIYGTDSDQCYNGGKPNFSES